MKPRTDPGYQRWFDEDRAIWNRVMDAMPPPRDPSKEWIDADLAAADRLSENDLQEQLLKDDLARELGIKAPPPPNNILCVACYVNVAEWVMKPCGHVTLCGGCWADATRASLTGHCAHLGCLKKVEKAVCLESDDSTC